MSFFVFIFNVTTEKSREVFIAALETAQPFDGVCELPKKIEAAEAARGWCNPALPTVAGIAMTKRSPSPSISESGYGAVGTKARGREGESERESARPLLFPFERLGNGGGARSRRKGKVGLERARMRATHGR